MNKSIQKYLGIILLVTACMIALISYDEYGLTWDDNSQHKTGIISYEYVFSGSQDLLEYKERDYGVAFELPLVIIEKVLDLRDSRSIFLMRHLVTHFFFLVSAFFCFLIIDFLYENKFLSTIGFLLVVLHPRLYAHSFFNTKDIPFMSMFLICFYVNAVAFSKKQAKYFILLGVCVGLLINLRIMGVVLFCLIPFFLMIDALDEKNYKINIKLGFIFICTALATLYITWPFLWLNPIENFIFSFKNMASFRWASLILFNGQFIKAEEVNWNYIPVWFSITTPIFYIITGGLGFVLLVFQFIKKPSIFLSNSKERNNLFFLICFLSPVVSVIAMRSVLYDGWRHLYFIYPSFVLLSVYGLSFLYKKNTKKIFVIAPFIVFIFIASFMIKNHPFQHVYFNEFVDTKSPEHLRKQFELDYWGTSYKQALEYILKHDNSPSINVAAQHSVALTNKDILTSKERERINFVKSPTQAKYFITNYRWHPDDYPRLEPLKWHSIKVGNNTINSIFKLR